MPTPVLLALVITALAPAVAVGLAIAGPRRAAAAATLADPASAAPLPSRPASRTRLPLPTGYLRWLRRRMVLAGRPEGSSAGGVVLAKVLLTIGSLVPAALMVLLVPRPLGVLLPVVLVVLAFWAPDLLLVSRGTERQQRITLELPDTLDQMTISVEAGLGFEAAMAKAATNGSGPLNAELVRTLQDLWIGRSRRDSYEALAARTSSADLRRFVRAVIQADLYGISIADVLRVQASEMRLKRRQRAEEQAMKVPVKVLFPLMVCILPVLFIVILAPAAINAFVTLTQ